MRAFALILAGVLGAISPASAEEPASDTDIAVVDEVASDPEWQTLIQPYCDALEERDAPATHDIMKSGPMTSPVYHQPAEGVLYQPGAEKAGVASPYLPGYEPLQLDTKDIVIPLRVPLSEEVANPERFPISLDEMFVEVGDLHFVEGVLYLNDVPLERQHDALATACAALRAENEATSEIPESDKDVESGAESGVKAE